MVLTKEQATEQVRKLIEAIMPLPVIWEPFVNVSDDQDVLTWLHMEGNELCQGKKEDFDMLGGKASEYYTGRWAETILLVLGVRVR